MIEDRIQEYKEYRDNDYERPDWDSYFLGLAFLISQKSHDPQTQHGCVIVDVENHILGTGYNGFPKEIPDFVLPNLRPMKYNWMIHSEANAIYNCVKKPIGARVYVTGEPCHNCLLAMWQVGIKEIIHPPYNVAVMCKDEEIYANREMMLHLAQGRLKITTVTPNFDFVRRMLAKIEVFEKSNGV